ncbi:MAG: SHOCT domain-containing protein [Chloroflexi bacterium]|nr:SHOCT domain-containing protein [Chloroflexota bacterium]
MMFLLKAIGISLFIGGLIAWSGGSVFPPLFNVAAPFVCDGKFSVETQEFYPRPGEVDTTQTIFCDNPNTGKSNDITLQTIIVAGIVYSAIVFIPVVARIKLGRSIFQRSVDTAQNVASPNEIYFVPGIKHSEDPSEKLKKLKEMREAGLITEQEYEAKRSEIISKM